MVAILKKKSKINPLLAKLANFDLKPFQLKLHLDKYVVGQEIAKRRISTIICNRYNAIRENMFNNSPLPRKENVLLLGPTGVGKTYIAELALKHIGVPFFTGDATSLTESGYVGGDVDDLVQGLYMAADNDLTLAQIGVIYVDEIDKLCQAGSGQDLVSRKSVQHALLRLMEGKQLDISSRRDDNALMFDTSNVTFFLSGAFSSMAEKNQLKKRPMHFGASNKKEGYGVDDLYVPSLDNFAKAGMAPEFIGRISQIVPLHPLTLNQLVEIINLPTNELVIGKSRSFASHGIDFSITPDAKTELAKKANVDTGARGLGNLLNEALSLYEFVLPNLEGVDELKFSVGHVMEPEKELEKLLRGNPVKLNDGSSHYLTLAEVKGEAPMPKKVQVAICGKDERTDEEMFEAAYTLDLKIHGIDENYIEAGCYLGKKYGSSAEELVLMIKHLDAIIDHFAENVLSSQSKAEYSFSSSAKSELIELLYEKSLTGENALEYLENKVKPALFQYFTDNPFTISIKEDAAIEISEKLNFDGNYNN
jgi:ATP-dependent Clp protease ATP-binding subunit ClpX